MSWGLLKDGATRRRPRLVVDRFRRRRSGGSCGAAVIRFTAVLPSVSLFSAFQVGSHIFFGGGGLSFFLLFNGVLLDFSGLIDIAL